jgi:hypothetical protein
MLQECSYKAERIACEHKDSRQSFERFMIPELFKHGFTTDVIKSIAPRVRYGKNFNDFTLLMHDPNGWGPSEVDVVIHNYLKSRTLQDKIYISTVFIADRYSGPILSCGLIYIPNIADNLINHGVKRVNHRTGQVFVVLPFSHPSIATNTMIFNNCT